MKYADIREGTGTYCRQRSTDNYICTRDDGHDGPHAAHGPDTNVPYIVWDAAGTLWTDEVDA